jgi:Gpi18-like mannosyltransferase
VSNVLDVNNSGSALPDLALVGGGGRGFVGRFWRRFSPILKPVGILCVSRAFALAVLYLNRSVTHQGPLVIQKWDVGWYLRAAQYGWPHQLATSGGRIGPSTLAFFPGFPFLIRCVHAVTPLGWGGSGVVAVFIAQVAMVIAFWYLARDIWGGVAADQSTVLLCFFPGAFIFSLIYSEPLLLAAACASILALRRHHWVLAGLLAAVATATRPNGVAVVACCAWEAFIAIRARREWRALVSVLIAPAGVVGWFAYLWASTGSLTVWYRTERDGWNEHESPMAIVKLIQHVVRYGFAYPNYYVPLLGTAVAVLLLILLVQAKPPGVLLVYTGVVLVMSLLSTALGLRPRFVLTAFPLIMVLGYRLKGTLYALVAAGSATLMTGLLLVSVTNNVLVP